MLEFLGAGENIAFVVAIGIMLLIGVLEAVGLGTSAIGHDIDLDGDGDWLGWLGVGRLPLLALLVLYLAMFAVIGLAGQQVAAALSGHLLPALIATPAAGVLALPATGLLSRPIGRIVPRDETTAISIDRLVGLHATIVVGRAAVGNAARARVRDQHGQAHHVLVEPSSPEQSFGEGDEVLLVDRRDNIFLGIASDRPAFSDWITR